MWIILIYLEIDTAVEYFIGLQYIIFEKRQKILYSQYLQKIATHTKTI